MSQGKVAGVNHGTPESVQANGVTWLLRPQYLVHHLLLGTFSMIRHPPLLPSTLSFCVLLHNTQHLPTHYDEYVW
jgi:hypothetical protein